MNRDTYLKLRACVPFLIQLLLTKTGPNLGKGCLIIDILDNPNFGYFGTVYSALVHFSSTLVRGCKTRSVNGHGWLGWLIDSDANFAL